MANKTVSKGHLLVPANALERIAQAVRELGWDMAFCTEANNDEKVIGLCIGEPAYVARMTGSDCDEYEHDEGEGEVRH